jgi:replication-associated recombination protein RarA
MKQEYPTLPKKYRPTTVEGFVGPAREIASKMASAAATYAPIKEPGFFLFYGEPGTGKSSLCKLALTLFNVDQGWGISKIPGTDLGIERVQNLAVEFQTRSLTQGYRAIMINEVDCMPKKGQIRFLELCDDIADFQDIVVIVSCNSHIDDLEKRFQSRFQPFETKGPGPDDKDAIIALLKHWLSDEDAEALFEAASHGENGRPLPEIDMRAVMNDATTMLL